MDKILEKIKTKNPKRMIENAVIFVVLLVILIIVINSLYTPEEENTLPTIIATESPKNDTLESKLEKVLSMIDGAGKVNVMISYLSSEEQIPLYDVKENTTVTEEKDKEGGTRKTEQTSTEQSIIFSESSNNKQPFIKQTTTPKVIGVIVVAEGASNMKVKENLINAVEAVLDVPSHRVQVFTKQK
ncbi:MAG: stage III sporulation protein AG [Clostridia bacterium]|nr:stage III sporulation protein AG [Clostridia bacterium]